MTKRIVALAALLASAGLWLLAVGPLARLAAARTERARLTRELARPPLDAATLLPAGAAMRAPDGDAAGRRVAAEIVRLAHGAGLLAERVTPVPAPAGLALVEIALSGPEAKLFAFVSALERVRPAIRLAEWRMEALPGGVRLSARAASVWSAAAVAPVSPLALGVSAAPVGWRRLFGAEAAPAAGEGPELIGVVGRLGRDAVALVRTAEGRARSLAPGETVDGWRLETLSPDAALFTRGAERLRVPLPPAGDGDMDEGEGEARPPQ